MCEREPTGKLNAFDERKVHIVVAKKVSQILSSICFSHLEKQKYLSENDIGKYLVHQIQMIQWTNNIPMQI